MLARIHLILGILTAVPIFFWASSGLLYALPEQVEGSSFGVIDPTAVRISASEALARAGGPLTALTLQNRNGRPEWSAIRGLTEVRIDAQSGSVERAWPSAKTTFFRQAHFWWFLGGAQNIAIASFALLACASSLTGLLLAVRTVSKGR